MKDTIAEYRKSKGFLVCVDSDGCAMDTMEVKHRKCFAPKAIELWELQDVEKKFLETWNKVNLYSKTRGINRFKGLVKTFELLAANGIDMPDFSSILEWNETSPELSNPALKKAIEKTGDEQLVKTLAWSKAVNKAITELPKDDKPFSNVKEGLAAISSVADIAIVSSANGSAVNDEWTRHELAPYVQVMLGQEAGSKAACISDLKEYGYSDDKILMVGDAPGDLKAAVTNGALYYPILVGKEDFSWTRLASEALPKFIDGSYRGEYQEKIIDEFNSTLK
ncbi:HAD family hydrolase [Clostridium sediminicola]|uniref:HAD family hydrolase n=1 Tax=Clostridium sediminicola TaxID=3114879 RepID=UPI0031F20C45